MKGVKFLFLKMFPVAALIKPSEEKFFVEFT
jgi:hypothetical protein